MFHFFELFVYSRHQPSVRRLIGKDFLHSVSCLFTHWLCSLLYRRFGVSCSPICSGAAEGLGSTARESTMTSLLPYCPTCLFLRNATALAVASETLCLSEKSNKAWSERNIHRGWTKDKGRRHDATAQVFSLRQRWQNSKRIYSIVHNRRFFLTLISQNSAKKIGPTYNFYD